MGSAPCTTAEVMPLLVRSEGVVYLLGLNENWRHGNKISFWYTHLLRVPIHCWGELTITLRWSSTQGWNFFPFSWTQIVFTPLNIPSLFYENVHSNGPRGPGGKAVADSLSTWHSELFFSGGRGVGSVTKGWSKFSKGVARCPCVVGLWAPQFRVGRVGGNLLPTAV